MFTSNANDLLQLAMSAAGGLERWNEVQRIDATLSIRGRLWHVKGTPQGRPNIRMQVEAHRHSNIISPFPVDNQVGHYEADRVWFENQEGRLIQQMNSPRTSFVGHVMSTPWKPLQELYFTGYAFWNYFNTPFILSLPGFILEELSAHEENNEIWRRLRVVYPEGFPTHCAEQIFYFGETGALQRLDYVTDVLGGIAAHYCYDHTEFGGLIFPTLRRVVRRNPGGPLLSGPSGVLVTITDIAIS